MSIGSLIRTLVVFGLVLIAPACGKKHPGAGSALVIGLDGATWKLLRPWMEAGDLPHLKSLVDSGVSGDLTSVVPFLSPPAWTSAVTGVNPGKHGIFDFLKRLPNEMTFVNETSRSRRVPAIWQLLSDAKIKVGVINVPASDPPDAVNGFMISGMPHTGITGYTYPPELEAQLTGYRIDRMDLSIEDGTEDRLLEDIMATMRSRAENVNRLLDTEEWDMAWVVFTSTDRIQHFFWQYMDPQWPKYDEEKASRYGTAIHDLWVELDGHLGTILETARRRKGADLPIVVLSDHGFGGVHREFRMQSFLRNPGAGEPPLSCTYSFETNGSLLYLNVEGREPNGVVSKSDYEAVRNDVLDRLKRTRDPETGLGPARATYRREEAYIGRYADKGPDIVMTPSPEVYISNDRGYREPWGTPSYTFSGHHEMEGILIATGGPFVRGRLDSGATLLDITPTILYLLGQPVPNYCDGRVLTALFQPDYVRKNPVRSERKDVKDNSAADTLDQKVGSLPYMH